MIIRNLRQTIIKLKSFDEICLVFDDKIIEDPFKEEKRAERKEKEYLKY